VFQRLKNRPVVRKLADAITARKVSGSTSAATADVGVRRSAWLTITGGREGDCIAVRVGSARAAFRELPIHNHGDYTFIDFGSGRGRVLFLAAEHFRKVQGVEFALEPIRMPSATSGATITEHVSARSSSRSTSTRAISSFRTRIRCSFFNPFEPAVMSRVLAHLSASWSGTRETCS
jgi:hypothetical protein